MDAQTQPAAMDAAQGAGADRIGIMTMRLP